MGSIIDEAMEKADPHPDEYDRVDICSAHQVRAAIEHAVRRCAEVAYENHTDMMLDCGCGVVVSDAILRAAGLEGR